MATAGDIFTDASANLKLGWGAYSLTDHSWSYGQWSHQFLMNLTHQQIFWNCLWLQLQ